MGGLLKSNVFFDTEQYYDYNKACLKLKNKEVVAVFCKPPALINMKVAVKTKLIGVICFISTIFLLITFMIYASLPSLQNLHGKTIMCHIFSLAMAFFILANINLNPLADLKVNYFSYYMRKTLGIIYYFLINIVLFFDQNTKKNFKQKL